MKKEREELEQNLLDIIQEYDPDKKVIGKVKDYFVSKGFTIGRFNNIINQKIPLPAIDLYELYSLNKGFYGAIGREGINPSRYFTDLEIGEAEKYHEENNETSVYPIIFKNVEKIYDDYYTTHLTAQEVADLFKRSLIVYNEETQRNPKIKKVKDKLVEQVYINPIAVNEIKNRLLENKQITNSITINLLQDGEEDFSYDKRSREITIKSGSLNIIDGMHRSVAMMKAILERPDLDFIINVNLTNFDVQKCKRLIVQEDKKNKIDQKYIKSIDENNYEGLVINKLNETGALSGKISPTQKAIAMKIALVLSDTLTEAIKHNFNITERREALSVARWLQDGFDEIMHIYKNEFANQFDNNIITNNNMFIGYVAILSKLRDRPDWQFKLKQVLSKLDFSTDNQIWSEIGILNKNINTAIIKKISNYFISLI